ncbi:MAG: DHA2 family efflux MFS transporter permease subunit [Marinifilaceae bacterium]
MASDFFSPQGTKYKWIMLFNVMLGTFMVVLDATIVNTGLPTIMGDLGTSLNIAEWVLTAYMLSLASILPVSGWLIARFGSKIVYIAALVVFTCGSFMCGNSGTITELIFWRVIQGMGSGIVMPVGMVIVTNAFPVKERGLALGFWAIASAASVSFGPAIGGYLVDNMSWNYIFYVNVPVGFFSVFFTWMAQQRVTAFTKLPFDFWGFLTSVFFLPVFLYGLSEVTASTNTKGWDSPLVLGCMWFSAVNFVIFLFVESIVKNPLINIRIFADKNFSYANMVVFIFGIGMFGSTFIIPLYLQDNMGYSALQTGLMFLPVGVMQAIVSPLAGNVSRKIDPRIVIIFGLLVLSSSFYMNFYLSYLTDKYYVWYSLVLRGLGMGILFPPLMTMSLYNIRGQRIAEASSITNILRQVGGSFGVAIFSHLLTQRTNFHTRRYDEALAFTEPTYHKITTQLKYFFMDNGGMASGDAATQAKNYVLENINTQANISGVTDVFMIAFIITLCAIIPVLFLSTKSTQTIS